MLGLCVCLLWPAQSLARALIRFVHGVPGVGAAQVKVDSGTGEVNLGAIGFAQVTPWRSVRSGRFRWTLAGAGKTLAQGTATVGSGAYDIVVLAKGAGVALGIYKAEGGRGGTSLVRVIHGAPELGSPELTLDSRPVVNRLSFTRATPYLSVKPGAHSLAAMRASDSTPLVSSPSVRLMPDVAYSAIVLGSRGQRVRIVNLVDRGGPLVRSAGHAAKTRPPGSEAAGQMILVRPGDSLWTIARSRLPAGASDAAIWHEVLAIWHRNAGRIGTGDPNLIFSGTRLQVP